MLRSQTNPGALVEPFLSTLMKTNISTFLYGLLHHPYLLFYRTCLRAFLYYVVCTTRFSDLNQINLFKLNKLNFLLFPLLFNIISYPQLTTTNILTLLITEGTVSLRWLAMKQRMARCGGRKWSVAASMVLLFFTHEISEFLLFSTSILPGNESNWRTQKWESRKSTILCALIKIQVDSVSA